MTQVKMPQLGETVIEGTIIKWLKQEGEQIAQDEPLFEISTDKVDTEVPSPAAGTLTKILVPEGQTVSVGTDLAMIESGDGSAAGSSGEPAAAEAGDGSAGAGQRDVAEAPGDAAPDQGAGGPARESAPIETPQ